MAAEERILRSKWLPAAAGSFALALTLLACRSGNVDKTPSQFPQTLDPVARQIPYEKPGEIPTLSSPPTPESILDKYLKEGDRAEDFTLVDQLGKTVRLFDFIGKKPVVLFISGIVNGNPAEFYPYPEAVAMKSMFGDAVEVFPISLQLETETTLYYQRTPEMPPEGLPILSADWDWYFNSGYGGVMPKVLFIDLDGNVGSVRERVAEEAIYVLVQNTIERSLPVDSSLAPTFLPYPLNPVGPVLDVHTDRELLEFVDRKNAHGRALLNEYCRDQDQSLVHLIESQASLAYGATNQAIDLGLLPSDAWKSMFRNFDYDAC